MKVSVIISNRNDTVMLAITVRSIIEELKSLGDGNGEIVICDNSIREYYADIEANIPKPYIESGLVKLIQQEYPCLFTARETAAREASGEYLICLDSHTLVGRDMILDLVNFMDFMDSNEIGFAHAPINWCHQHESKSRHDRDMSVSELGNWGAAYKYPTKITWKGMPWICRKGFFLGDLGGYGALSYHKMSWGGGDMHIGIKPWLLGYQNWAVSTSPAIHLGPFPGDKTGPLKYRYYKESGKHPPCTGFLVSSYVLGGDWGLDRNAPAVKERFKLDIEKLKPLARELGQNERDRILRDQVISFQELLERKPWNDHTHNSEIGTVEGGIAGAR